MYCTSVIDIQHPDTRGQLKLPSHPWAEIPHKLRPWSGPLVHECIIPKTKWEITGALVITGRFYRFGTWKLHSRWKKGPITPCEIPNSWTSSASQETISDTAFVTRGAVPLLRPSPGRELFRPLSRATSLRAQRTATNGTADSHFASPGGVRFRIRGRLCVCGPRSVPTRRGPQRFWAFPPGPAVPQSAESGPTVTNLARN
jgi:hypothetical protein